MGIPVEPSSLTTLFSSLSVCKNKLLNVLMAQNSKNSFWTGGQKKQGFSKCLSPGWDRNRKIPVPKLGHKKTKKTRVLQMFVPWVGQEQKNSCPQIGTQQNKTKTQVLQMFVPWAGQKNFCPALPEENKHTSTILVGATSSHDSKVDEC
jgi:hypothetical protein